MSHEFCLRVYYEDTDLAGIVYYANYLKFIERARTEFVRKAGIDQTELKKSDGIVFAVRRVEADYVAAARFDDLLSVRTKTNSLTGARIILHQDIKREGRVIFRSIVTLVALSESGKATRLPANIRLLLK